MALIDCPCAWNHPIWIFTPSRFTGSADRGLYRVHQFSKVEMFVLSTPDQSEGILEDLCSIEEEIFQELGLHYKVLVRHMWLVYNASLIKKQCKGL